MFGFSKRLPVGTQHRSGGRTRPATGVVALAAGFALVVAMVAPAPAFADTTADAGTPASASLAVSDSTVYVDACDASAGSVASVTVLDDSGVPVAGVPVTFTVDNAAVVGLPTQPVLTDGSGVASVTLSLGGQVGVVNVSATAGDGAGGVVPVSGSPAQVEFAPNPHGLGAIPPPSFRVAATGGGTSVLADGVESWTGTVTVLDQCGVGVPGEGSQLSFVASSGVSVSPVADHGDGTYTVTFTSTTPDAAATVSAFQETTPILGPLAIGTAQPIPFAAPTPPFDAAQSVLSGTSVTKSNTCRTQSGTLVTALTLTARDTQGNLMADLDVSKIDFVGSTSEVVFSSPVVNNGDGTYTVQVVYATGGDQASVSYDGSVDVPTSTGDTSLALLGPMSSFDPDYGVTTATVDQVSVPVGGTATVTATYDTSASPDPSCVGDRRLVQFSVPTGATATVVSGQAGLTGTDSDGSTWVQVLATTSVPAAVSVSSEAPGTVPVQVEAQTPVMGWWPATDSPISITFTAPTPTPTGTPSETPTATPSETPSATPTPTPTPTPIVSVYVGSLQVLGSVATVTVTDEVGAPVAGVPVTFTATGVTIGGAASVTQNTGADGTTSVTLSQALQVCAPNQSPAPSSGQVQAQIMVDGSLVDVSGSPASVDLLPAPGTNPCDATSTVTPTGGGSQVVADGVDSWTVVTTVTTQDGQPVPGFTTPAFRVLDANTHQTDLVSVSQVTDEGDGTYSALLTSTTPGDYQVYTVSGDQPGQFLPISFVAVPTPTPTPSETPSETPTETPAPTPTPTGTPSETPTATPSETPSATPTPTPTPTPIVSVYVGSLQVLGSVATVTVTDEVGAPVAGVPVTFTVVGGGSIGGASSATQNTDAGGQTAVEVDTTAPACRIGDPPATVQVRATMVVDGVQTDISGSPATLTPQLPPPGAACTFSDITAVPSDGVGPVVADGADSWTMSMTVLDQFGQPVEGLDPQSLFVVVDSAGQITDLVSVSQAVDVGGGRYSALLTSDTPGDYQVATWTGDHPSTGQPIEFVAVPTPTPTPTETPTETPTAKPSETPSTQPSETPSTEPSQTPSTRPSETPSTQPSQTTPPPASRVGAAVLKPSATSAPVGGDIYAVVTVTDTAGAPMAGVPVVFTVNKSATFSSSGMVQTLAVTTDSTGKATAIVSDAMAESVSVAASVESASMSGSPAALMFTATYPAPTILSPKAGAVLATATPVISGTAVAGATVSVTDAAGLVCTTVADATGAWHCQPIQPLPDGPLVLTAVASSTPTSAASAAATVAVRIAASSATTPQKSSPTSSTTHPTATASHATVGTGGTVVATPWGLMAAIGVWAVGVAALLTRRKRGVR